MKAFLSHSSNDQELVRAVAKELGRQFCLFDEQVFSTGDEFKDSIEKALDASSVFVFFASRKALESIWVKFELKEAWFRRLNESLSQSIVYIIDSSIGIDDLPEWLRRALIRYENSSKLIARDIRFHLDELLRRRQHPFFVGRSKELEELEQELIPFDGNPPPHAIFITGLPGVGRRTLAKNSASSILNLKKHVEIRIREGDSLQDICILVADRVEPYSTKELFEHIVQQIRSLSPQETVQRTLDNLRKMTSEGELPVFFDEGGLLDSEGYIREPIQAILRSIAPNDTAYLFLISSRRPADSIFLNIPTVHINPLHENDIKRLITMLSNQNNLKITPGALATLATYVAGYPPSAYFAIQQAKTYGLELVLSDQARLVQFRTNVFLQHLSKLQLDEKAQSLLRLLAAYSPLPLVTTAYALDSEQEAIQDTIIRLIDLALVTLTEDGYYRIADPVKGAAENAFGWPSEAQSRKVAGVLNLFLQKDLPSNLHRLELSRVLFRAARLANNEELAKKAIHFASDLVLLTENLYHARRYEDAIQCGYMALEERPDSINARSYLIRALIQEERWSEAEDMISKLQRYAPRRDIFFLTGFLERKKGNIPAALSAYQESQKNGRRGIDLNRELAYCYFLDSDLEQAQAYIEEALERDSDNRFLVDLWVQILTSQGNEEGARQALDRLELIDTPMYYHHRASRIALAFNKLVLARDEAQKAVDSEDFPPFEILAQLIYCEIELGNTGTADSLLQLLDQRFGNIRRDIRAGLRCRLEIARGKFSEALSQSERIIDKKTYFYKKIRRDAIAGEIRRSGLSDKVRASYEQELDQLEKDLENARPEQFIPAEIERRTFR